MKKRTGTLLLAMVLALSVVGCGSSSEPKQEEQEQEKDIVYEDDEEGENKYADIIGIEFENDDIFIKVENTEQTVGLYDDEWEEAYGQLEADKDIPIYCDGGFQVGHIKEGAVIDITEHGITNGNSSAYYRFPNPISDTPFDYLYVSYLDCNYEYFKVETESSLKESAEKEQEQAEVSDPYDSILEKVGYDKDKTYTTDEYLEVLIKICEEMGKEYNLDLAGMSPMESYDGFHIELSYGITEYTEETTKSLMTYMEIGKDGLGGVTEFCAVKATSNEGEEGINVFAKIDHAEHEKNRNEY